MTRRVISRLRGRNLTVFGQLLPSGGRRDDRSSVATENRRNSRDFQRFALNFVGKGTRHGRRDRRESGRVGATASGFCAWRAPARWRRSTSGAPLTTLVGVASDWDGAPLFLMSELSRHTRNLDADARASLLLTSEGGRGDPLNHPRVTLNGIVRRREGARRARRATRSATRNRSSTSTSPTCRCAGSTSRAVHFNGGFGRADPLTPADLLTPGDPACAAATPSRSCWRAPRRSATRRWRKLAGHEGARRVWRPVGLDAEGLDLGLGGEARARRFRRARRRPRGVVGGAERRLPPERLLAQARRVRGQHGRPDSLPRSAAVLPFSVVTWNINSVRLRIETRRPLSEGAAARRAVPAGDEMPGREFPVRRVREARLRPHRAQRAEGLPRRRHRLAPPVRRRRPPRLLREGRQPPCRRDAGRARFGGVEIHNFYVPAGGDEPDRQRQPEIRPQARFRRRDGRLVRARAEGRAAGRSWSAISTSRRWSTTSGATRRCSTSSATRRSRSRNSRAPRRRAGGTTRCAISCRTTRSSTPGGATARRTGAPPTRAAGSTMSGSARRSPIRCRRCGCFATRAAGSGPPTTRRCGWNWRI